MKRLNIPIVDFRDTLNKISPSFCAAKWQQVTLHLQTGHTHSCHHPPTHRIPLEELKRNPSALHNTEHKKEQRRLMLEGERPVECDYCWKIEDSAPDALSDRTYKSFTQWAQPYINSIAEAPWDNDVVPTYLEISFSSVCNFKCSYCGPQFSSKWMEEIEKHGPYPTTTKFGNLEWLKQTDAMPIPHREENPYVEAFWRWWPEIHNKLHHFRITGGEPLLAKDTFRVLDWYIENPNLELELSINTNMCPPDGLLDKFIEKLKILQGKVKKINLFTSAEAHGRQAEYIRNGLDYNQWLANIRKVLSEVPDATFTIMSTYNIMSVHSYTEFLKDILQIKRDFTTSTSKWSPVIFDSPYLRWPPHQAIFIMPKEWAPKVAEQVQFVIDNAENYTPGEPQYHGFTPWEVERFKRMNDLVAGIDYFDFVTEHQIDFIRFVDEHDARRGTNFLETFPEFTEVYHKWKAEL